MMAKQERETACDVGESGVALTAYNPLNDWAECDLATAETNLYEADLYIREIWKEKKSTKKGGIYMQMSHGQMGGVDGWS